MPEVWKKNHLVKLPKKGDLSSCNNQSGIMLQSIPRKALTRIILERVKTALDKQAGRHDEQAGFCQERSCTEHIVTIISKQSLDWQTLFVDFQQVLNSVNRNVIWGLMYHYGFPTKFVNIIPQLYEDATCQIIHKRKLTEPFSVTISFRQGCLLSPTILLMDDWIMRQSTAGKKKGIKRTFTKQLEDLEFEDDISSPTATRVDTTEIIHKREQRTARPNMSKPRKYQQSRQVCIPWQCSHCDRWTDEDSKC